MLKLDDNELGRRNDNTLEKTSNVRVSNLSLMLSFC